MLPLHLRQQPRGRATGIGAGRHRSGVRPARALLSCRGILTLKVGKRKYEALISHRYKGHSVYHDLQPVLRLMRDVHPKADRYATGHNHSPAHMNGVFYPEARPADMPDQHFVVSGTFKTQTDLYTIRNFGGRGILGLPTMMPWPDRHLVQYSRSSEMAVLATRGWR